MDLAETLAAITTMSTTFALAAHAGVFAVGAAQTLREIRSLRRQDAGGLGRTARHGEPNSPLWAATRSSIAETSPDPVTIGKAHS